MNGKEIVLEYKAKLNNLDTQYNRLIKPEIALLFINDAFKKVVRGKYFRESDVVSNQSFQTNQKTTDELNSLVKTFSTVPKLIDGEYVIDNLPGDYFVYLKSKVEVAKLKFKYAYPRIVSLDRLEVALRNPFFRPNPNYPLAYFSNGHFILPKSVQNADQLEIVNCWLSYLSMPEPITLQSVDVNYSFMDEVIDTAVTETHVQWGVNKPSLSSNQVNNLK